MIPNFVMPDDLDSQITIRIEPEVLSETAIVLHLKGFIDTYNSQFFAKQVQAVVDAGYVHLVLACSQLTYISSTGVGAFTALLKEISKKGTLTLAEPANKILEVFHLLGFSAFFTILDSLDAARDHALSGGKAKAPKEGVFPLVIECPICTKKLKTAKPGTFRCPECKTALIVNETGQIAIK